MDTIWIAATILITVWLVAAAIFAVVGGPQPRVVHVRRDTTAVLLMALGVGGYLFILDNPPEWLWAAGAGLAGAGLGYLATWRNGALPDNGLAITWTSPWLIALFAASAAAVSIGNLGAGDVVAEVGLYGLVGAVGFGAGALGFGVLASSDVRRTFQEELNPVTICGDCGAVVSAADRHCASCGSALPAACSACGLTMSDTNASCTVCGTERSGSPAPEELDAVTARFCLACFERVSMEADYCANCASHLSAACPLCGAPIRLDHDVCPLCDIDLHLANAAADAGLIDEVVAEIEAEERTSGAGAPAD